MPGTCIEPKPVPCTPVGTSEESIEKSWCKQTANAAIYEVIRDMVAVKRGGGTRHGNQRNMRLGKNEVERACVAAMRVVGHRRQ